MVLDASQVPALAKNPVPLNSLLVQHNALVNAHFRMTVWEMRIFQALLSRISIDDDVLATHLIPVKEINTGSEKEHNRLYEMVAVALQGLMKKYIQVEEIGPNGEREKYPALLGRNLMGVADYLPGEGMIRAAFNVHMKPYMVGLRGWFTSADPDMLEKIKSPASHRIYWLLAEYRGLTRFERAIPVQELRDVLGLTTEYLGRFDHFRARVLDVAQKEMAETDLPFTYTVKTNSQRAASIVVFNFAPVVIKAAPAAESASLVLQPTTPAPVATADWDEKSWQALMIAAGVSSHSLKVIQEGMDAKKYPERYIRFVDWTCRKDLKSGKLRNLPGAVYKGIVECYYINEFRAYLATEAKKVTAKPTGDEAKRRKLQSQLDDLSNSLKFQLGIVIGTLHPTEDARQVVVGNIRAEMAAIEALLH